MGDISHKFPRLGTKTHRIALIDGPNMSNLGRRSKKAYGPIASLDVLHEHVRCYGRSLGVEVETFASNYEGAILEFIHESADRVDGYLVNPAGLTSGSLPVPHALIESGRPSIEVHFANPEASAHSPRGAPVTPIASVFSPFVTGKITGLRHHGYIGALVALTLALDDVGFLGAEADSSSARPPRRETPSRAGT
jgi:3-dehydroquinate dehydratase II